LRLQTYTEPIGWTADVISTTFSMNREWIPKKITTVEKQITQKDKERSEVILSAVEKKNGKISDLTEKYRKDNVKKAEKNKDEDKGKEGGRRNINLSLDEYLPFSPEKQREYSFRLLEDSTLRNRPVLRLDVHPLVASEEAWEGVYFIDRETFDILRAEIGPSKNPGPLKLFEMELDLVLLEGKHLVIQRTKVRIHVGLIVKNIRIVSEENYGNYQLLK
ncbi:MAG: hypothetical protein MUP70_09910, partial [Candidatus Aminicenantes bacterium]|nr:hypothetical protein [Candidatus Aminicenantes bacterium]